MKQVKVMSGIPGSGKSTIARKLLNKFPMISAIASADDLFTDIDTGEYNFNSARIGEAHARCFRQFIAGLQRGLGLVIVDNTCSSELEIAPYMLGAAAFGYEAEIIEVHCGLETAMARNTHKVPEATITRMYDAINTRKLPPWWKVKRVHSQENSRDMARSEWDALLLKNIMDGAL